MERIRQQITRWVDGRPPAELAVRAAGVIVIAIVPGALTVWLAYQLIRTARTARAA
jgi:hypothetical protein